MNLTQKEQWELVRARKSLNKINIPGYMAYLLIMLSMVYIWDEIASNINSALQSGMVTYLCLWASATASLSVVCGLQRISCLF